MAVLNDTDRKEVWAEFMRHPDGVIAGLTKAELRAAVDALDDYFNTNAASINTAIPQPARGALSTAQKAKLAKAVLTQRYIKGS